MERASAGQAHFSAKIIAALLIFGFSLATSACAQLGSGLSR